MSESEFVSHAQSLSSFHGSPDDLVRQTGKAICHLLDEQPNQNGWLAGLKALTDDGFDPGDTGAFITYSVAAYCPHHGDLLPH